MQRAARKDGPFPIKNPRFPQRLSRPARGPRPHPSPRAQSSARSHAPALPHPNPRPRARSSARTRVRGPLPPRPLPQNSVPRAWFQPQTSAPVPRMRCRKTTSGDPRPPPAPCLRLSAPSDHSPQPIKKAVPFRTRPRPAWGNVPGARNSPPCAGLRAGLSPGIRPGLRPGIRKAAGKKRKTVRFSPLPPFVYSMPNSYCSSLSSTADMIMAMTPETMAAVSAGTSVTSLSKRRRKNTPGHSCVFVLTMGST